MKLSVLFNKYKTKPFVRDSHIIHTEQKTQSKGQNHKIAYRQAPIHATDPGKQKTQEA